LPASQIRRGRRRRGRPPACGWTGTTGVGPAGGSKAFEAQLAADRKQRIAAGRRLLINKHIQASAAARGDLAAGQVDPRLLVTLSTLADLMPLQLIAFDDL
jgi:hypothetical protein